MAGEARAATAYSRDVPRISRARLRVASMLSYSCSTNEPFFFYTDGEYRKRAVPTNNDSTHQEPFFLFWVLVRIADVARYGVFAKRVLEDASHHKRGRLGYECVVVGETPLSPGDHSPSLFATI